MESFFNPIHPDPHYHQRNFKTCFKQYIEIFTGNDAHLGLIEYLLVLPAVIRLMIKYRIIAPDSLPIPQSFMMKLYALILLPFLLLSVPFVFIYHKIIHCIAKTELNRIAQTKQSIDTLEIIPFKAMPSCFVIKRDTAPPENICFETLQLDEHLSDDHGIVQFNNGCMYYFNSDSYEIIPIEATISAQDFNELADSIKNSPEGSNYDRETLLRIERLLGFHPFSDEEIFTNTMDGKTWSISAERFSLAYYYDNNKTQRLHLDQHPSTYINPHHYTLEIIELQDSIVILGLFNTQTNRRRPEFFIVPNQENALTIKNLIAENFYKNTLHRTFCKKQLALFESQLKDEDPFQKIENLHQLRIHTPVFLLQALGGPKSHTANAMKPVYYNIIARYADLFPSAEEQERSTALLNTPT